MVGINDLFDISAAFTIIRSDMHYEKNIDIIKSILCTLKNKDFYEQNIKKCFNFFNNIYCDNVIKY